MSDHSLALLRRLLLAALLAAPVCLTHAAEPPSTPSLRLEAGMHTAQIRRIASDAQGRWLVTASDDKTARVWEIESGRLLRVLRPPLGVGNEGMLYAVALSPDGATVAMGGQTGYEWDGSDSIYLFDRNSGELVRRIAGLPEVINHLAFSPDGRWLAASLNLSNGVRVFEAANGREVRGDRDYHDVSLNVSFSRDSRRLVTTSYDGQLRLYTVEQGALRTLAQMAAPGGKKPYSARFSPDGRQIAVGFSDTQAVNVLYADTLKFAYAPDTRGVDNGELSSVAWSADGQFLYAAGSWPLYGDTLVRRWSAGGRGAFSDIRAAGSTVMDLVPLPDGRLVFGAADSTWSVISAQGKVLRRQERAIADLRSLLEASADGQQVRFGYDRLGKSPAVFDLTTASLRPEGTGLNAPRTDAPGLTIANWNGGFNVSLNGQPLALEQYEQSFSLAFDAKAARFVLGTSWYLRLFDRTGKQLWWVATPGSAWSVNISSDDKLVVVALGDGTIRWYRIEDGQELLALFPHADRKRWVLWTPSGYYDASAGGEDLIGWHVNRGKEAAADFFPVSRFREHYYRPDVIERVVQTRDEAEALRQANAAAPRRTQQARIDQILPPSIELLSPKEGERFTNERISVRVRLRAPADAPVTALKVRLNARPLELGAQANVAGAPAGKDIERALELTLPREDVLLQVFAENRNGVSTPAQAKLVWAGAKLERPRGAELVGEPSPFAVQPKLYLLAVGVSAYDKPELKLNFAAKDAKDFAALFRRQKGVLYREVEVKLLTDGEVSRDSVADGLEWLQRQVTSKDFGILFLAGHGITSNDGLYYFAPANFDADRVKRTGVVFSEIQNTMSGLAGKALFFVDTCHSGSVLGKRRAIEDLPRILNELASAENGVVVFSSSTGREGSLEDKRWGNGGNGAFTAALLEGLAGKADTSRTGRITHKMLDFYVSERVKALTNGVQHPVTQAPGGVPDFPIAVVR